MSAQSDANRIAEECFRISMDPSETPERRAKAAKWHERLLNSTHNNGWGNDGKTMAEARGIEVAPDAPGGQRLVAPERVPAPRNESEQRRQDTSYGGRPLSSELSSSDRGGHWTASHGRV